MAALVQEILTPGILAVGLYVNVTDWFDVVQKEVVGMLINLGEGFTFTVKLLFGLIQPSAVVNL